MKWNRSIFILVGAMLSILIAGCASSKPAGQGGTLAGTCWELKEINATPMLYQWWEGSMVVGFSSSVVYGHTGVNDFRGTYTVNGAQLSLVNVATTLVEDSAEGVIFTDIFPEADTYTASGQTLILYDKSSTPTLKFTAADASICLGAGDDAPLILPTP